MSEAIQNAIVALLEFLASPLPDKSFLPLGFYDAWYEILQRVAFIDNFFPINLIFYAIASIIIFELLLLLFRLVFWVINFIRG